MSNHQKKTILIAGYYGFENTGDEAILISILSDLRKKRPNLEFIVVSGNPEKTARQYKICSILWTDMPAIMEACQQSDLILVGGGGLFHDYWGTTDDTVLTQNHSGISFYSDFPIFAALYRKPCVIYSVGVGPLQTEAGKRLTRLSFEIADTATVRDVESLALLNELDISTEHVKVTADPAFLIQSDSGAAGKILNQIERGHSPLVAVCLRNWDVGIPPETWQKELAGALDRFVEKYNASLIFIPFQVLSTGSLEDDRTAGKNVASMMKNSAQIHLIQEELDPTAISGVIGQCDLVVGMRLHALIFSVKDATPAVGIVYDPKVRTLMRSVDMEDYVLDIKQMNSSALFDLMDRSWQERGHVKFLMTQKVGDLKLQAEENNKRVIDLLEGATGIRQKAIDNEYIQRLLLKQTRKLAESEKAAHTLWLQLESQKSQPAATVPTAKPQPVQSGTSDEIKKILGDSPVYRPDIICFSIIDWEFRYQRPQQIMSQFAAQGHRVFYISPSRFLPADAEPAFRIRRIRENVYEVGLAAHHIPNLYGETVGEENLEAMMRSLGELRDKCQIQEAYSYVMIASWADISMETRRRWGWHIIYDCMDEWDNFPLVKKPIVEAELRLVQICDLLVVTAQRLYEKWQQYDRPMVLARNAADYEFYEQRYLPNDLLADMKHPIVGYYGAIADWFDLELMAYIAENRPAYTFVLLGGVFDLDISRLQALPNVHWLGQQPYETMPQYLYHFDACIIPFKKNPITEATDPVKIYEYMCGGKPVVSVSLSELKAYKNFLYLADDRDDFLIQLDQALAEKDADMSDRRRFFAQQNTWDKRVLSIDDAIENVIARKIELDASLPLILPAETLISSRVVANHAGMDYWHLVYESEGLLYKQTSRDLAEREYRFLSRLGSVYFPEPVKHWSEDDYSVVVIKKIEAGTLQDAAPEISSSAERFHEFAGHCLDLLSQLSNEGITHRDIRRENIRVINGKPVLLDMGWAVTEADVLFHPFGLGGSERPMDGSFSDVYSMGKILEYVSQRRYPVFDWVISLMAAKESSMRIPELDTYRSLFDLALSITKMASADSNDTYELLSQVSKRDRKIEDVQRSKGNLEEKVSYLEQIVQDLLMQVEALKIHTEGLELHQKEQVQIAQDLLMQVRALKIHTEGLELQKEKLEDQTEELELQKEKLEDQIQAIYDSNSRKIAIQLQKIRNLFRFK